MNARQLGLDIAGRTALGREDFLVAPSNALAVALIDAWPAWSTGKVLLTGPQGAGKTHLAHVWAARSGAAILAAAQVQAAAIPALAAGPVAIEDVERIAGDRDAETALFHLHNLTLANGHALLLTGRDAPGAWGLALPDLLSRLQGAASAQLLPPDDGLLAAVLAKQFNDRQILPKPDVIAYLVARMDRSFAAAREIVAALDAESLARKKPITRKLATEILERGETG